MNKIEHNISTTVDVIPAFQLYKDFAEGRIVVMQEWLQRLTQKKKWTKNKGEKIKSYLYSFFTGDNLLQPFFLVNISVLMKHIDQDMKSIVDPSIKKLYTSIQESLQQLMLEGVEQILLDGQNRLKLCLKGFFDSELEDDSYPKPFSILDVDEQGNIKSKIQKNNFKFKDLTEEQKQPFKDTQVLVINGLDGRLKSYVDSLIHMNNGEPWSLFEGSIIEFTPLTIQLNNSVFRNVAITSMFGSEETNKGQTLSGNVKGMTGNYLPEKKGDARYLAELTYLLSNNCNSGMGTESDISKMLTDETKKEHMKALENVIRYITDIVHAFNCLQNSKLKEAEKPFDKEELRGLIITLDILLNKNNFYHDYSPIKLSSISDFGRLKTFCEEFVKWHRKYTDQNSCPEDFTKGEPNPSTYVIGTRATSQKAIKNRITGDHGILQFLDEKSDEFMNKNIISSPKINYTKYKNFILNRDGYTDQYARVESPINLRSKVNIDHVISKYKNGSDDPENLKITNPITNKIKSNKF